MEYMVMMKCFLALERDVKALSCLIYWLVSFAFMTWHDQVHVKNNNENGCLVQLVSSLYVHPSWRTPPGKEAASSQLEDGISECACTMIIVGASA